MLSYEFVNIADRRLINSSLGLFFLGDCRNDTISTHAIFLSGVHFMHFFQKPVRSIFSLVALLLSVSACVSKAPISPVKTVFETNDAIKGTTSSPALCAQGKDAVWADVKDGGECIRFYPGGLKKNSDTAIIYFTGDLSHNSIWNVYEKTTPASFMRNSNQWSNVLDVPYILMARPGTFGSSGYHYDRRREGKEGRLLNAAVDAVKEKYGLKKIVVVGQSGGGHVVAQILTLRNDISCAVMASALLSFRDQLNAKYLDYADLEIYLSQQWDPIDHVADIPKSSGRRIFIIADPKDEIVYFDTQQKYVAQADKLGVKTNLVVTHASGGQHHDLSKPARYIAALCAKAKSTKSIVKYVNRLSDVVHNTMREKIGNAVVTGNDQAIEYAKGVLAYNAREKFEMYLQKVPQSSIAVFAYSEGSSSGHSYGWALRNFEDDAVESALYNCESIREQRRVKNSAPCRVFAIEDKVVWKK